MSTQEQSWEHNNIRAYFRNGTPVRVIRFTVISRLQKAISVIARLGIPYDVGNNGNDFLVPREALVILRKKLPRFYVRKI